MFTTHTVPYQTFGHAAAATAAAIATFCDALATPALQSLTHLSLLFDCPDYNSLVGQNAACFERAHSQLWGHVVRTLRDALQVRRGVGLMVFVVWSLGVAYA